MAEEPIAVSPECADVVTDIVRVDQGFAPVVGILTREVNPVPGCTDQISYVLSLGIILVTGLRPKIARARRMCLSPLMVAPKQMSRCVRLRRNYRFSPEVARPKPFLLVPHRTSLINPGWGPGPS